MTTLYIDGVAVSLPEDFSVAITDENPFLTNNGGSTYDITLSLLDKVNAKLYKHKNRTNESSEDIQDRTAVLIVNDKVFMRGTEVILAYESTDVKIQLVSGNSALNYSFSDTKKIWEYDFGNESSIPHDIAEQSLSGSYPTWKYICPPFLKKSYTNDEDVLVEDVVNLYTRVVSGGQQPTKYVNGPYPCPYLIYYLEKFLEIKGLNIKNNCLRDDVKTRSLYVLNQAKSNNYAKILPDWTEAEFITELENFFNITISVDVFSKQVEIKRFKQKLTEGVNHIKHVLVNTEVEIDKDNKLDKKDYSNVEYDLPGSEYFNYQNLIPKVLDNIIFFNANKYSQMMETFNAATLEAIYNRNETADLANHPKILIRCIELNQIFIPCKYTYLTSDVYYKLSPIDNFSSITKDKESSVSLKIIPAEMKNWFYYSNDPFHQRLGLKYAFPCSNSATQVDQYFKLSEIVAGSSSESHPEYLQVAFFAGFADWIIDSTPQYLQKIPFSYTDKYDMHGVVQVSNSPNFPAFLASKFIHTLKLKGAGGLYESWYDETAIDASKPHTFYFIEQEYDINLPFVINNKKFICEKIEYDLDKNGVQGKTMKGTFYPLQIL